ncbi:hypothetical protein M0802_012285 [Mischocyttarus mexicanus]|nr:hypothetical protein M0802_012285 [Mischocyttarus mexicanus]
MLDVSTGGILKLAKSIGSEGFLDMAIEDFQDLLVEEEVDKADLMEIVSEAVNQIDSEDTSTDEDCAGAPVNHNYISP